MNPIIQQYNARFQHSLVGKWASAEGTFSLMYDVFEFEAAGKGTWLSVSGQVEHLTHFEWRSISSFTVEMREEADKDWLEIGYEFKLIHNDVQPVVILCQKGSETFYLAMTRLTFIGNLDD